MTDHSRFGVRAFLFAGPALVLLTAVAPQPARAQGKLEATYALTVARLPMGRATATIDVGSSDYAIALNGKTGGVLRVLSTGEGTLAARGTITDGRPVPTSFNAKTKADDDAMDVTMTLEDGSVKELTASAPPPNEDRVEVSDAQKKNIVDPLTALLVPAATGGDGLSQAACDRTLPVFDGRRRYDLKLAFKRMDKVKSEKGYAGPVVVCAMKFSPVAGHRPSSSLMKFLSGGREMEITFAPMAGTRLLAAYRVAVNNMLGNLVVQATRFEMMPPARASNE
jgi:hypothetical protein